MSAIRLARAATGREKLLKFAGAYHGHVDGLLAEAGSGLATAACPPRPGCPRRRRPPPWSCPGTTARPWRRRWPSTTVAAILAEPYPANMGLVPPAEGFLAFLREQADANGALLVFDEVISGFRVARGGRAGARGRDARPDRARQGDRRGRAGRRLRRPARPDGAGRARRRRLPGGHALGEPAGHGRGAGDARAARRAPPTSGSRRSRRPSPTGCARRRRRRRRAGARDAHHGPAHRLLPRRPGGRLRGRQGLRHWMPTPPSAARCSTAASTCRRRSSRPGSRRSPTPTSTWSARSRRRARRWRRWRGERARATSWRPRIRRCAEHAAPDPGPGPVRRDGGGRGPAVRARGGLRGLPAALRRAARVRRDGRRPAPARRRRALRARPLAARRERRPGRRGRAVRPDLRSPPAPTPRAARSGRRRSGGPARGCSPERAARAPWAPGAFAHDSRVRDTRSHVDNYSSAAPVESPRTVADSSLRQEPGASRATRPTAA